MEGPIGALGGVALRGGLVLLDAPFQVLRGADVVLRGIAFGPEDVDVVHRLVLLPLRVGVQGCGLPARRRLPSLRDGRLWRGSPSRLTFGSPLRECPIQWGECIPP